MRKTVDDEELDRRWNMGARLEELINKRKYNQSSLARDIEAQQPQIARTLAGEQAIPPRFKELCDALGTTADYVLFGRDKYRPWQKFTRPLIKLIEKAEREQVQKLKLLIMIGLGHQWQTSKLWQDMGPQQKKDFEQSLIDAVGKSKVH